MNDLILNKINKAISKFYSRDEYLLINNLNERTIAHKFASYLQVEFDNYDVDCEYNKNVDEDNGAKNIYIVKNEAEELKRKIKQETEFDDIEYTVISIYPDIVIHKRGGNDNNLLIIEIKKSSNNLDFSYDHKKLQCYTENSTPNSLKYKFGLFIEFETGVLKPKLPSFIWYKDGKRL
ncbi:hypothetical protein [Halobacillus mangrovi]|uniref:hypothetical protein n=1 Tax=Halobacillus mangrovi TaxID=402384 RepID=UPI003D97081E